ncbi:MAG: hypothetical protein IIA49_05715 [Bacteroidetes bacterium]|nr:hypothetical protein [Bacteroidota bacterium]
MPKCGFSGGGENIEIDVTPPELTINSPENKSYGTRRIAFNITTTKVVNKIEFIKFTMVKRVI